MNWSPAITPEAGHATVTTSGWTATLTLAEAEALTAIASVTVKDSVLVPLVGSVLLKVPVPVYGPDPPLAVTVQSKGLPDVTPEDGHDADTTRGWTETVTVAVPVALTPLASWTVNDSTFEPFVDSTTLLVPVPEYGRVPPDASTVQLNGLPTVTPLVGHVTATTKGCAAMVTVADPAALAPLLSVTENGSENEPLTDSVMVQTPVPVEGDVPPVAEALQE